MLNDIIVNKSQTIERCIKRVREEYGGCPENLNNFTKQDSMILNIQRSCEAAIDLAMHLVAEKGLGLPQSSREVFDILCRSEIIDAAQAEKLKAMVGFRNIAVHDYQAINLNILKEIIERHLDDLSKFAETVLKY